MPSRAKVLSLFVPVARGVSVFSPKTPRDLQPRFGSFHSEYFASHSSIDIWNINSTSFGLYYLRPSGIAVSSSYIKPDLHKTNSPSTDALF